MGLTEKANGSNGGVSADHVEQHEDGKLELTEEAGYKYLGFCYPTWRKWQILMVMFAIQISINLNASLYANGVAAISEQYGVSEQGARVPQLTFLCAYAFGCMLWAPWSEEIGRWKTQQASLLLVNIWQIPCALAPNYSTFVVCRLLGGLSTAGGSVTLGVLADMWEPDDQEYAIAFLVLSSVGGSVVGAVVGGFVEAYASLNWIFWVQLCAGGFVQILHALTVPETRSTIILTKVARGMRESGENPNIYGPKEVGKTGLTFKEVLTTWIRPFYMLFTEPIIAWLSAVSGFSDALIFTFLQGFTPVYQKWGFSTVQISLAFLPLIVGYILAYFSFLPSIHYFRQKRRRQGSESVSPEARLWWLRYLIPCEFIGLAIFAATSLGPSYGIPWIAPMIGTCLVGIANYAVYQSSIDYTVAAYGVYAASATGGNDFARDFLSGVAALYSVPMFTNIGSGEMTQVYPSIILAAVAFFLCPPLYYFYRNGEKIRKKSKFASEIEEERRKRREGKQQGNGAANVEKGAQPA